MLTGEYGTATVHGAATALYNLDQPVVLGKTLEDELGMKREEYDAYRRGLKRGAVEALCMVLGYKHNVNELWGSAPLTIERGKYGRYENGTD